MTIFEQYAALQRQIKDLQAQADALKAQIIAEMPDRTYTAADGSQFSISYRKKWNYTSAVIEAEEKTGQATYEEAPVLSLKLG